jgi:hypothetical protein
MLIPVVDIVTTVFHSFDPRYTQYCLLLRMDHVKKVNYVIPIPFPKWL